MKQQIAKEVKKTLVLTLAFLIFLLAMSLIQAKTIQDLINSYSFDYYGLQILIF
ncbi:hypothetical protein M0R19_00235 [Candidatus Pacearchaeota archaeon]|nr:hypothetical protein [Candidatus Pacearchaeota archaeon]